MVLFNYSTKELTSKVVYYGPGLCGKTTNLQYIHANLPTNVKGKMLSLATKTDRTLFFDFLPLDLGTIRGMKTRIQLYTVPGQVFYNETRKLVLKGADGIVFVADSQEQMKGANVESFRNLEENLKAHGMKLGEMPHIIQFNKRDLPNVMSIEDMNTSINKFNAPFYESVATTGIGVQDSLKAITKLVLLHLTSKYDPKSAQGRPTVAATPSVAPAAASDPPVEPAAAAASPVSSPGLDLPLEPEVPVAPAASTDAETAVPISSIELPDEPPAVPVEPVVAEKASPPPPPNFHGPSDEDEPIPEFGESEIEDMMGEVAEVDQPVAAQPVEPVEPVLSPFPLPDDAAPADAPSLELSLGEPEAGEAPVLEGPASIVPPLDEPGQEVAASAHEPVVEPIQEGPASIVPPMDDPIAEFESPLGEIDVESSDDGVIEIDLDDTPEITPNAPVTPAALDETVPLAAAPLAGLGPAFEVDTSFDPEVPGLGSDLAASAPADPVPAPVANMADLPVEIEHDAGEPDDVPITLTEVAGDDSLFTDPGLEVAKVRSGGAQEIIVPVELGDGLATRRFKLTVTLRFDPVDD